jgi:hypothetical protein
MARPRQVSAPGQTNRSRNEEPGAEIRCRPGSARKALRPKDVAPRFAMEKSNPWRACSFRLLRLCRRTAWLSTPFQCPKKVLVLPANVCCVEG